MKKGILSISAHRSLNYLLKTILSPHYIFHSTSDVFHGLYMLKNHEIIELILVDIDDNTEQNLEFIAHINTSGFYQMPVVVLGTNKELQQRITHGKSKLISFVTKPFNPEELLALVENCFAHTLLA